MNFFLSKKYILITPVVILAVYVLAAEKRWYWGFWSLDILLHIAGGFWVAMVFIWFFKKVVPIKIGSEVEGDLSGYITSIRGVFIFAILCLGFVALVGVLWELWEFLNGVFLRNYSARLPGLLSALLDMFKSNRYDVADIFKDLVDDLLGGILAVLVFARRSKNKLE